MSIHGTESWKRTQLHKYWTNTSPLDWIDGASCDVPRYHVTAENVALENNNGDGYINYRGPYAVVFMQWSYTCKSKLHARSK
jgi:hypothetical protein